MCVCVCVRKVVCVREKKSLCKGLRERVFWKVFKGEGERVRESECVCVCV